MAVSEAHKRASIKWQKENYKRIPLDVTPAKKDEIKAAADSVGLSVGAFIKKAIDEKIERMRK